MGKLSASLVVDITDKTGAKTKAIIGNMNRLQRAERDLALADRGAQLSRRDRALERVMIERETSIEERRQRIAMWAARGGTALAVASLAAGKAYKNYADVERQINRIVLNADKGAEAIRPTMATLQKVASDTRMSFADATEGLETLVASGRSLEDALGFLPSVAVTAQASGAAISDVALSADSMAGSMQIGAAEMQRAFDILVAGGKAGKFELRDMSQYLPSLLPAFAALGYEGTEGLQKIVAILQVMRNQAGSSSEAATYLGNVLNKMYSEETSNKFKKFGIDIRKELDLAKASGKDVIDVFVEMAAKATKGDLAKLPMIFTDSELQKGMRALITQRPELEKLFKELGNVDGTALKDVNQIFEDSASKIQKMSNLWGKFTNQIGTGVASVANPVLETVTTAIDDATAQVNALKSFRDNAHYEQTQAEYIRRYQEVNPDASWATANEYFGQTLIKLGHGQIKSVLGEIDRDLGRVRGANTTARFPSRGAYQQAAEETLDVSAPRQKGEIAIPQPRPVRQAPLAFGAGYPSPGSYERETDAGLRPDQKGSLSDVEALVARAIKADIAREARGRSGFEWLFDPEFWLGKAAGGGTLREQIGFEVTGGALGRSSDASAGSEGGGIPSVTVSDTAPSREVVEKSSSSQVRGPQDVSLRGIPTIISQPSGVQLVQVTNLPVSGAPTDIPDARDDRLDPKWFYDAGRWREQLLQRHEDTAPLPQRTERLDRNLLPDRGYWPGRNAPPSREAVALPKAGAAGSFDGKVERVEGADKVSPTPSVLEVQVKGIPPAGAPASRQSEGGDRELMLDRGDWPGRDMPPSRDDGLPKTEARDAFDDKVERRDGLGDVSRTPAVQDVQVTNFPTLVAPVSRAREGDRHELMLDRGYWPGRDAQPTRDESASRSAPPVASSNGSPERQEAAESGPQEVSLLGTPTVISQPSGVQQVQVMNPPPAPQINMSVVVHATTNASPQEIGDQAANAIGQRVKAALAGVHADTEYSVG